MYSRQIFGTGFWEGRMRGDACMGHLLKRIRDLGAASPEDGEV